MTSRRKILWLVLVALIAATFALLRHDRFVQGPVYHDAPLSVWLRALDDPTPDIRDKARDAIRHIGPAASPLIIEWLDWKDSFLRRLLSKWVAGGQPRISYYPLEPKDRRRLALSACDALGPDARPAVPKLIAIATARNPELDAPFLIARIRGANALPDLALAAATTNKYIRAAAGVCADSLRSRPDLFRYNPADGSEDLDYNRRLVRYHQLVMETVASNAPVRKP